MPVKPIISNNSPLVSLWGLNLLSLFRDLYTEVWIPREVEREFLGTKKEDRQQALNDAPWIKTVDLTDPQNAAVYQGLDDGEAEVLALAKEHNTRFVLLDEKKARQEAKRIGLIVKGTVGILLEAKKKGLIHMIKPLIIALENNGMHLSKPLIDLVLREAGEA